VVDRRALAEKIGEAPVPQAEGSGQETAAGKTTPTTPETSGQRMAFLLEGRWG